MRHPSLIVKRLAACAALLLCAAVPRPAGAEPGYYVVTAYDNAGLVGADFRYWSVAMPGRPGVIWPEVGVLWGVTSRWTTELYGSYVGVDWSGSRLETLNWQNEFLLTQGEYPFDLALHARVIEHQARVGGGHGLEWGPVLQTDVGRTQLNANVFVERRWASTQPASTELKYQWQVRYRYRRGLHVGAQGFGELGPWDHWLSDNRQSHRAGPAIFGTLPIGRDQPWTYQASYLFGRVFGQQGRMLSIRVLAAF